MLAGQPRADKLAATEALLTAELQAMQNALIGSGHDLSGLTALQVCAVRCDCFPG